MGLLTTDEYGRILKLLLTLPGLDNPAARDVLIPRDVLLELDLDMLRAPTNVFLLSVLKKTDGAEMPADPAQHSVFQLLDGAYALVMPVGDAAPLPIAERFDNLRTEIRARVVAAAATIQIAADPYLTSFVQGSRPFLDRSDLRRHLKALASDDAIALVVNGLEYTGKSYTGELIQYLGKQGRIPRPIILDVGRLPRDRDIARDIVEMLAQQLGMDITALLSSYGTSSLDRWILKAGNTLVAHCNQRQQMAWVVLDTIKIRLNEDPAPEAGEALRQLGQQLILCAKLCDYLRVVLIGFPEGEIASLGPNVAGLVRPDYTLERVDEAEIERFLGSHFSALNDPAALQKQLEALTRLRQELASLQQNGPIEADQPAVIFPILHRIFPEYCPGGS